MASPGPARIFATGATATVAVLALIYLPVPTETSPPRTTPSASTADTAELTRLTRSYLQQRADMVTAARPTVEAASGRLRTTPAMTARARSELAALVKKGLRYEGIAIGYTRARVDVEVTSADVTGRTATLRLTDHTRPVLRAHSAAGRGRFAGVRGVVAPPHHDLRPGSRRRVAARLRPGRRGGRAAPDDRGGRGRVRRRHLSARTPECLTP
ncbi:hypothetical protein HFP70_26590 [Streptomyces sp. ARC14]|uniref:hypothetical protein n=1 Tax=Streptomyces sp. ARC14 TaxID=2724152 RepID=UPI0038575308